jgi:hypothetical protein
MSGSDDYWHAMFPGTASSSWVRFKRDTTGRTIAERYWELREEARRLLAPECGDAAHRAVVVSAPDMWCAACVDCTWLDHGSDIRDEAVVVATEHAGGQPPEVALRWLPPWERRHPAQVYRLYRSSSAGLRAKSWSHSPTSLDAVRSLSHGHRDADTLMVLRIRAIGGLATVPDRTQHTALTIQLDKHWYGVCGAYACHYLSDRANTYKQAITRAASHVRRATP